MPNAREIRQAIGKANDELDALRKAAGAIADALTKAADGDDKDALAKADKAADEHKAAIEAKEAEVEKLNEDLKAREALESKAASLATPRKTPNDTLAPARAISDATKETVKNAPLANFIAKLYERHKEGEVAAEVFLEKAYGTDMADYVKSVTHQLSDYASGGALSLPDFAETIISGLENMTVIRRMNPTTLTVPGSLIMPRETSAPSGSWLSENARPTPGKFQFGEMRLDPKRLAVETVVSRKLLDMAVRGGAAVRNLEGFIVRRLRERLAVNEDAGFLRGGGTGNVPLGVRSQIVSAHAFAQAGTTSANIESDLSKMERLIAEANIIATGLAWVMSHRTRSFLADLRVTSGDVKVFPSIEANNTLKGYPIMATNQIPNNLGGGTASEIMLLDGPSLIVANAQDAAAKTSLEATYFDDQGNPQSCFQNNEMLVHLELEADIKMERPEAGAVLTGVTYGA